MIIVPSTACVKGQHYAEGSRSSDLFGRIGVWFFSTKGIVGDHRAFVAHLLPGSAEAGACSGFCGDGLCGFR